jgi:molybdenum cofactor cytidylyltransferase
MFEQISAWLQGAKPLPKNTRRSDVGVGLLLAAGRGSRFDPSGQSNKLLTKLDGIPLICHSASHLADSVERRIAVIRPESAELKRCLGEFGYKVVECPDAHSGMGHSLAWGVAEAMRTFDMQTLVVALGDMPYVKSSTISSLLEHAKGTDAIVAPSYQGKRGNPVVFSARHFESLSRASGDRGAAKLMEKEHVQLVDVDDPGIHHDVDQPNDIKKS